MKLRLLALSLLLFVGFSAAQSSNNTSIDGDPGWVKADSPVYGHKRVDGKLTADYVDNEYDY